MIENTQDRDPLLHLTGSMGDDGLSGYIEGMEADGQRQLVASTMLPTKGPWKELEGLGFVPGDVDPRDPLFRSCTLPEGWRKEASDHDMWSHVVDERGIRRVGVFYKAAFYDRSAHCSIQNVGYALASDVIYGTDTVKLPDKWAVLTDEERAALMVEAQEYLDRAAEHPGIYGDREPRARQLLELAQAG